MLLKQMTFYPDKLNQHAVDASRRITQKGDKRTPRASSNQNTTSSDNEPSADRTHEELVILIINSSMKKECRIALDKFYKERHNKAVLRK